MKKTQICTYIKSFFKNHLNLSSLGCIHITYNQMLFEICLRHNLNISEIMHVHSLFVNLLECWFLWLVTNLVKSLTIPWQEGIHFVVCRKHKCPYYAILGQEGKECNRRKFRNFPFSDVG
jgi:hypothetical protein